MPDRQVRGTVQVVEAQVPVASDNATTHPTELGPSRRGWWAGVVAFLIGSVVLLAPWPPGVHYSATEADAVNERSGWASCGTPVLGAWTLAVNRDSDEGSTLVAVERPHPEGAEEDPWAAAEQACRTDAAARVGLLAPGIVLGAVTSYLRARRRGGATSVTLSDRGDAARFAWAGFLGIVTVTAVGAAPAVYFATLPVALVSAVLGIWMVEDLRGLCRSRPGHGLTRVARGVAAVLVVLIALSMAL